MVRKVIDELPHVVARFRIWVMTNHSTPRIIPISSQASQAPHTILTGRVEILKLISYIQYAFRRNTESTYANEVARLKASRQ